MDILVSSSSTGSTESTESTTESSSRRIQWGHVYYRPYARTVAACGIPEDITYSLALSNSIVLYDTKGNITGGYDPFLQQPVSIYIESSEIGVPALTNTDNVLNGSLLSQHSSSSSSSNSSNISAESAFSTFSSSLSVSTANNDAISTSLSQNDTNILTNDTALSPLESTALTLINSSGNESSLNGFASSSSSFSSDVSSSTLHTNNQNRMENNDRNSGLITDSSIILTNQPTTTINSSFLLPNEHSISMENGEISSSSSSSSSAVVVRTNPTTTTTIAGQAASETESSSVPKSMINPHPSVTIPTTLSSPTSLASLSSPTSITPSFDESSRNFSVASVGSLFSNDSSFSSDDLSFLLNTPTLTNNHQNIPRNPPPRPLLGGEVYGGTLDEFDREMMKKKEARESSSLASVAFLHQRKRGRNALNVSSIPLPLPWFGLNAKQRASRISSGVLSCSYSSLATLNTDISNELRTILASRKKSNTGCRCSLLASTELQPLPIKSLRTECELRNLASTGSKTVLITRLIEHSQKNLGCIRKASLPTVIFSKYLEPYGPNPTKVQRNQAKRKTKEELQYLKLHNYHPVPDTNTNIVLNSTETRITNSVSSSSSNNDTNIEIPRNSTEIVTTTEESQTSDNILASNLSSNIDIEDDESINTETYFNETDEEKDDELNNIAGDTEARLLKAHKTAVKLAENLAIEKYDETLPTLSVTTGTYLASDSNVSNEPSVENTLTVETAIHIQNTPVIHQGAPPGTLVPALDICPCAASGEGCHFNRCLCDPSLCDNRACGDPGASSYDDVGIFLHRELIRTLQSSMNDYFYPPAMIREWRSKQMLAMSQQVVMNDEDDDDQPNDNDGMDLLFGEHDEYLDDDDDDDDNNNVNDGSVPSSGENSEHLNTESDMLDSTGHNTMDEFSREAASRIFATLTAWSNATIEEESMLQRHEDVVSTTILHSHQEHNNERKSPAHSVTSTTAVAHDVGDAQEDDEEEDCRSPSKKRVAF